MATITRQQAQIIRLHNPEEFTHQQVVSLSRPHRSLWEWIKITFLLFHATLWAIFFICLPICAASFIWSLVYDMQHPNFTGGIPQFLYTPLMWSIYIGGSALLVLLFFGFCKLLHFGNQQINIAFEGIPSPAQIEQNLTKEWGREPTVAEIADVHQMLTSRHNQALLNAGLTFGGLYLLGHHGKI